MTSHPVDILFLPRHMSNINYAHALLSECGQVKTILHGAAPDFIFLVETIYIIEMFWLHLWEALTLSIFIYSQWLKPISSSICSCTQCAFSNGNMLHVTISVHRFLFSK